MILADKLHSYCQTLGIHFSSNSEANCGISISKGIINLNKTQLAEFSEKYTNVLNTVILHEIGHLLDSEKFLNKEYYLVWSKGNNEYEAEKRASKLAMVLADELGVSIDKTMLADCLKTYEEV